MFLQKPSKQKVSLLQWNLETVDHSYDVSSDAAKYFQLLCSVITVAISPKKCKTICLDWGESEERRAMRKNRKESTGEGIRGLSHYSVQIRVVNKR